MNDIIRGTTPTIKIVFDDIAVESIVVAILTVRQNDSIIIEKTLETAEVGEDYLSWRFEQEETLTLAANVSASICCDWKLADGTRGRSRIEISRVGNPGKNEVI